MQFYFFQPHDKTYLSSFREFATRQNAILTRLLSFIIFAIIAISAIVIKFVDIKKIISSQEVYYTPLLFLLFSSGLVFALLIGYRNHKSTFAIQKILSLGYAVVVIIGCMWITFRAQQNPGNTMTIFLLGIFAVGIMWIFDIVEASAISLFTLISFVVGLHSVQTNSHLRIQNYILGTLVVGTFFLISRILYTYHRNYFNQVKTIEKKNEEIGKMDKVKTEILGVVAHDLRSPINNVISLVDLIKYPKTTAEEKNEYYDMILAACRNSDHIIHDLIDAAKYEESQKLEKNKISLNDFIKSVSDQWKYRMPEDRRLIYEMPSKDIEAYIHEQKMQRVFDNLINNAIKFTNKDGIIRIDLKDEEDKITISITDNGVGIPRDLQPYLFDRFSRAGRNGLNGEKSYGLGLSICQQIIEQHGGVISVESEQGHGTSFHVIFPLS
ncbi:MAG TPA: HAMP domain-containing sensor histidine kinase [Flavipsychrobacter sp.]|nr:HAMP domain-containing sensor histidine kinase [Flavipsychrobacter sp.]